jgi:stress response protein SCP2
LKNNTPINGKAKYYFSDNWIRNSLTNFELDSNILLENLIFNILDYNNYTIYWGLNNSYNFTFFCQNNKQDIAIHLFFDNSRDKLKYHINKLSKLDTNIKKIILVKNTNELWIRKVDYENVQILEINEFIVNFTKNSY